MFNVGDGQGSWNETLFSMNPLIVVSTSGFGYFQVIKNVTVQPALSSSNNLSDMKLSPLLSTNNVSSMNFNVCDCDAWHVGYLVATYMST